MKGSESLIVEVMIGIEVDEEIGGVDDEFLDMM